MINFVFYNSYQNSYVGFQLSQYMLGSKKLISNREEISSFAETEKLLTNSGSLCALGKSDNTGKLYFVYRGLSISDSNKRTWYINLGIESNEESTEQFYSIITDLLLDFTAFENAVKGWFVATPDAAFSYNLDFENVEKYFSNKKHISVDDVTFYKNNNPYISNFKQMLFDMKTAPINSLILFVPETTLNYFHKQNPFFENTEIQYILSSDIFSAIIKQDKAAIESYRAGNLNENVGESKAQSTTSASKPVNEFIKENKHTIELACEIAIGTLAVVGAGILIKKIFFRR